MEFIIFFICFILVYEIMKFLLRLLLKNCLIIVKINKKINSKISRINLEIIKLTIIVLVAIFIGRLINYNKIIFGIVEGLTASILSIILDKADEDV